MAICNRDCLHCALEKCIEDEKPKPRGNYYKAYRAANEEKMKAYYKEWYAENKTTNAHYIKWVELKSTLYRLRKQLGTNNFELLIGEIEKLNKVKLCDLKGESSKVKENV